jgi:cardiolipin synthase
MRNLSTLLRPKPRTWISGNKVQILKDGSENFPEMLKAIKEARETIHLETYILRSDRVGWRFAEALAQKAREGVSVKLIYDSLGSLTTDRGFFRFMEEAGVEIFEYHPIAPWKWRGSRKWHLKRRDHRKILVVDGRCGFVGGINIGDEYADLSEGGGGWRDTQLKLEGPAVQKLQQIFLSTWFKNKKRRLKLDPPYYPESPSPGRLGVSIVASNGLRGRNQIKKAYLRAILRARKRICITNSYFLPPHWFLIALKKACRRGVEVCILVPKRSDIRIIDYATRALYSRLLKWGVRIFEWEGPVLHAKTAVIDGRWSTIGSSNLDQTSLFYNLEVNVVVLGSTFGDKMEKMFWEDLKSSREILATEWTRRNWIQRLVENTFYYFVGWI